MDSFKGKVAVITGAASGIGLGMAQAFADAGIRVVLSDVEIEALDAAAEALRAGGADVHTVVADVSDPEEVQALAHAALQRYGGIDDASAPPSSPLALAMRQWFREQVEQGLDPLAVGRLVLEAMRERRFYVFTHPEWLGQVEHRMQNLLHGRNPSASPLPGLEDALRQAR